MYTLKFALWINFSRNSETDPSLGQVQDEIEIFSFIFWVSDDSSSLVLLVFNIYDNHEI